MKYQWIFSNRMKPNHFYLCLAHDHDERWNIFQMNDDSFFSYIFFCSSFTAVHRRNIIRLTSLLNISWFFISSSKKYVRSAEFCGTRFVPLHLLSCTINTETYLKRCAQLCDAMRLIQFSCLETDGICITIMKFLYIYSSKHRTVPKQRNFHNS